MQACWKFLANNMSFFPSIAPMSELMVPFRTNLKVWEKSNRLFSKFDEIARKYKWMEHREKLPDLIRHFKRHEHLYWEMRSARPGEEEPPLRHYTDQERQEVWREAKIKFPNCKSIPDDSVCCFMSSDNHRSHLSSESSGYLVHVQVRIPHLHGGLGAGRGEPMAAELVAGTGAAQISD